MAAHIAVLAIPECHNERNSRSRRTREARESDSQLKSVFPNELRIVAPFHERSLIRLICVTIQSGEIVVHFRVKTICAADSPLASCVAVETWMTKVRVANFAKKTASCAGKKFAELSYVELSRAELRRAKLSRVKLS